MKFYKTENNELYDYEDDVPEFGTYSEVEGMDEEGNVTIEKVYPEFTVKEGLTRITDEEYELLSNPPKSDDQIASEILEKNTATQTELIKEANTVISIYQDAIDLDMQEDGDEDKLKAWKKYRVLLSRMDLTAEDMEIPVKP